jgi:virulence-associated protein VapD
MVCFIYDCNYVKVVPMKYRSSSEWVKAYDDIHQELTVKGFKPKLQTLENESSAALKNFFTVHDIAYQLVPPHCHRRNAAERAIRTFKEHFVAGLSSVDPAFLLHLWYRLLPQAEYQDCIHSSLPMRTSMVSWITTKHILLRQVAE